MALCCIGGVCVPYSAIVPLLIYGLRWLLQKMVVYGFLPQAWCNVLSKYLTVSTKNKDASSSCCSSLSSSGDQKNLRRGKMAKQSQSTLTSRTESCCTDDDDESLIVSIESQEEWESLLLASKSESPTICKFTASWCKPCKEIQPLYESLSAAHSASSIRFAVIDADEDDVQDLVTMYGVMALPTFVAVQDGKVVGKYSGSNEEKLRELVETAAGKNKKE